MLFSVVTRTLAGREPLLSRCQASVRGQTIGLVEHLILRDDVGIGVAEAQKMLWTVNPRGEYVLVLDDDDYLSAPDVLLRLGVALLTERPSFAVVKVAHGELGSMPRRWEAAPAAGEITVSNVIVANWLWASHRKDFGAHYAGDWDYIAKLFETITPAWIDVELVTVEKRRMGAFA